MGQPGRSLHWLPATGLGVLAISCAIAARTQETTTRSVAPGARATADPGPMTSSTAKPTRAAKVQPLVSVGDDVRRVDVLVPSQHETLAGGEALPLLVLLHGNNESPVAMAAASGADHLAELAGVLVALPPAVDRRWQAVPLVGQPSGDSSDVTYVAGLIEQLSATYSIDPERVFVAGFSSGATLAGRVACERAELVAAVALAAGTDWGGHCAPTRAVSILVMHGTNDPFFSIDGAERFAERWRNLDECTVSPADSALTDDAVARTSEGCAEATAVQFVRITGAGHQWFIEPSATETTWDFFMTYQRR
jgi:polyhydroxybutyrate depolymerase